MYEVCSHWWRIRFHSSLLVIWKTDPRPVVLADLSQGGNRKQYAVDLQRCFYYRFCLHFHLRCASMYVKSFLQQYEMKLYELDSSFSNEPSHPLLSFFVPVCTTNTINQNRYSSVFRPCLDILHQALLTCLVAVSETATAILGKGYCPPGPVPHPRSCKSPIIIFWTEAAILKDFVLFRDCLLKRVFPACMPAGELCLHWLEVLWEMNEECKDRVCDLIFFSSNVS